MNVDTLFARRVEEVGLNSWPALQQILFDGWLLRFSRGYTKRANSVNALYGSQMDVEEKVRACEVHYRERGLPAVFRITPFASPPDLDLVLAERGYRQLHPTAVICLDLSGAEWVTRAGELRRRQLDDWLALFCQLRGESLEAHQTHRAILEAIPGERLPVSREVDGQAVACALGVLEHPFFGLFDLYTSPAHRGRGHGTALVAGMLNWALEQGARYAYLQVMEENAPARRLYERLGYKDLYRYWYRVPAEWPEAG